MKKLGYAEAWFLGMNKFFIFHKYSKIMKATIVTFSLKRKSYILWEYVKNFKVIREEELIWDEFERLFKKRYLFERYYDGKVQNEFQLKWFFFKLLKCSRKHL